MRAYFQKFEHLRQKFQFIRMRVGGQDHFVDLGDPKNRGITVEAPRHSLMTAVNYEIFDDLLIGNFTKTVLQVRVNSSGKLRRTVLAKLQSATPALYQIARRSYRRFTA